MYTGQEKNIAQPKTVRHLSSPSHLFLVLHLIFHCSLLFNNCLLITLKICRPDITALADWALKLKHQFTYLLTYLLTLKIHMLCFVVISSVILNPLCVSFE